MEIVRARQRKFNLQAGEQFARWTVLSREGSIDRSPAYLCRCVCGVERRVVGNSITSGRSGGCGCIKRRPVMKPKPPKPAMLRYAAEYKIWLQLTSQRDRRVCSEWRTFEGFWTFLIENHASRPLKVLRVKRASCGYYPWNVSFVNTSKKDLLPEQSYRRCVKLLLRGLPPTQVSAMLGVRRTWVTNLCEALGIELVPRFRGHDISSREFDLLLEHQKHRCGICRHMFTNTRSANIDHDHVSGKVRGLLCTKCNMGLGGFEDKIATLISAMHYLKAGAFKAPWRRAAYVKPSANRAVHGTLAA